MTKFTTVSRFALTTFRMAPCLPAVLLSGVLLGTLAQADEVAGNSRSLQVKLADIDFSTVQGQQLAQARIYDVARTLCSRVADELDLSHHANFVKCVDSAIAQSNERLQVLLNRQPGPALARADVK